MPLPASPQVQHRPDTGPNRPDTGLRPVGWRLVGANNRELGRCARAFESLAACQAAVMRFRERVEDVRPVLAMADLAGAWTWRVELDGRDVAMAGRAYQRHRECLYNLNQFLAAVPVAQLSDGLVSRPRLRGLHLPGPARSASSEGPGEGDDPPRSMACVRIRAGAGTS